MPFLSMPGTGKLGERMPPKGRTTKLEQGGFSLLALIWSSVLHHLNNGRTTPERYRNFALPSPCSPEADLTSGDTSRKEYGSAKNAWNPWLTVLKVCPLLFSRGFFFPFCSPSSYGPSFPIALTPGFTTLLHASNSTAHFLRACFSAFFSVSSRLPRAANLLNRLILSRKS